MRMKGSKMRGLSFLKSILPDVAFINAALMKPRFRQLHGRYPVGIHDTEAMIDDYVFWKMTTKRFSAHEKQCVDKVDAKEIGRRVCPDLHIPVTRAIFDLRHYTNVEDIVRAIKAFEGQKLIAKPSHSCGKVIYLNSNVNDKEIIDLIHYSTRSFFHVNRERQYNRLKKRIVVEELLPSPIQEYKFVCVRGEPILCQFYRHDRDNRSIDILSLPFFKPILDIYCDDGLAPSADLDKMLDYAAKLSEGHDLLRVDLYFADGKISLGEMTLTPGASLSIAPGESAHALYSAALMAAILKH